MHVWEKDLQTATGKTMKQLKVGVHGFSVFSKICSHPPFTPFSLFHVLKPVVMKPDVLWVYLFYP
jgi:hypothetical protein